MIKSPLTPSDGTAAEDSSPETATGKTQVSSNVSGKVVFDDRGNALWQWTGATDALQQDAGADRLATIDPASLTLHEDLGRAPPPAARPAQRRHPPQSNSNGLGEGYSPYDSGLLIKAQDAAKRAKRTDLRRLSEWMKLRQQVNRNKRDDA